MEIATECERLADKLEGEEMAKKKQTATYAMDAAATLTVDPSMTSVLLRDFTKWLKLGHKVGDFHVACGDDQDLIFVRVFDLPSDVLERYLKKCGLKPEY